MWERLPAYFPNFPLRMLPLAPEAFRQLRETGWLREAAFRTQPRVNKLEIKQFLQSVYGLEVERVNTLNYQGKKKAQFDKKGKVYHYRLSDWKKAYVIFKPPADKETRKLLFEPQTDAEMEKKRQVAMLPTWQKERRSEGELPQAGSKRQLERAERQQQWQQRQGQQRQQRQQRQGQQRQASQQQAGGAVRRGATATQGTS